MSYPESEDFDRLRRLLALKRHEQPPPGYFQRFSGQVIARIQGGDRAEEAGVLGRFFWGASWLQRFWAALESKPILSGAVGAAACAFVLAGVIYSTEKADTAPVAYVAPQTMAGGLGLATRSPGGSVLESPTLDDLPNVYTPARSQSSLFPVQQINFTLPQ
jgi:hypothetical protein